MQTTPHPILRLSALAAPLAVAGAAAWGGAEVAAAAAVSSGVLIGNLWLWSVLGPRLVGSLAADDGGAGLYAAALAAKTLLVLAVVAWLLTSGWSPAGLAIGLAVLPVSTLLAALLPGPSTAAEGVSP
jgi:hypothetical protein